MSAPDIEGPLGPRANGLRTIRVVLACVAFGVVVNSMGTVLSGILYTQRGQQVERINAERLRNTEAGCVKDSAQNDAILTFLTARGAHGVVLQDARRLFPVRTEQECARLARQQVNPEQ